MSSPKGDWRIECGFVGLVVFIAVGAAMTFMWLYCNR